MSSPSLRPKWLCGKCGATGGGFDWLELAPEFPRCGCTIESDGSEIERQMKKKSRKENFEIKEKRKKNEVDEDTDRANEGGKDMCFYN